MKNRRNFLKKTAGGLLGTMVGLLPGWAFAEPLKKGIVKHAEEGETYFVRENTPITIRVSKKSDAINSLSICTEEILPGNGIAIHKHLHEDEMFFFHKGKGIFIMDGEHIEVAAGTTAFVPSNTWHGFKNTGTETVIFDFGYSPAGFEDFFRQIGTLKGRPFSAKTTVEIKQLANQYGMIYQS